MALITRFVRLFRADLHAVLDRLESPDLLLRQAIREMEAALAQGEWQLKARELEGEQLATRQRTLEATLARLAGELDLSFDAGNEALARTLLRRRLETERLLQQLTHRRTELARLATEQANTLDEQRRRLEGLRQKAAVFDAEPPATESATPWAADEPAVSDADVELAWLREQQRRRS